MYVFNIKLSLVITKSKKLLLYLFNNLCFDTILCVCVFVFIYRRIPPIHNLDRIASINCKVTIYVRVHTVFVI